MISRTPTPLMRREAARLFPDRPAEADAFLAALLGGAIDTPCVLWTGGAAPKPSPFPPAAADPALDWLPPFVNRLAPGTEPGKDPLHEAGACYSLDFSSVWAASALLEVARTGLPVPRVLDSCAAPGGKSVFASLALRPDFLLANEVIGKRLAILRRNLTRCRLPHAHTQRLDPRDLARLAAGAFAVVIVDAPCSGQSLLAKGIENPGAFHPATVKGNAKRQTGILTAAAACVAPGGWLLYATCTFSERENEGPVRRLLERRPDFAAVPVAHLEPWRSPHADFPAYRLFPHGGLGAGAFTALLRRGSAAGGEISVWDPSLEAYPVRSDG
ncbi:MAG: RsmB/NOP family class I SAM-dependent RNA methyltransferase [Verrucomicrobiales bacterium]|nr:RsmB/NOP family class I SAM-dependent RNA methyltransferase [Verrucomicrobiales bacterium]